VPIGTHFFAGWLVAVAPRNLSRRERARIGRRPVADSVPAALLGSPATDLERPVDVVVVTELQLCRGAAARCGLVGVVRRPFAARAFSDKGDATLVATLRHRFGTPAS
jgi:hypothetical protein